MNHSHTFRIPVRFAGCVNTLPIEDAKAWYNGLEKLVEPSVARPSITRQCELLGVGRSSYYYQARPTSERDLRHMRLIDEEYTRHPFRGSRRMRDYLEDQGEATCRDRVRRLMRMLGLQAIYPKKRLSLGNKEHPKYPYLLRGLRIDRPEIFNTDQGCQYTSHQFTSRLKESGVRISMDGRGRCFDNIMIERLWRSVKYEEVYLKEYASVLDCRDALRRYFEFYNHDRRHQGLGRRTPWDVYQSGV